MFPGLSRQHRPAGGDGKHSIPVRVVFSHSDQAVKVLGWSQDIGELVDYWSEFFHKVLKVLASAGEAVASIHVRFGRFHGSRSFGLTEAGEDRQAGFSLSRQYREASSGRPAGAGFDLRVGRIDPGWFGWPTNGPDNLPGRAWVEAHTIDIDDSGQEDVSPCVAVQRVHRIGEAVEVDLVRSVDRLVAAIDPDGPEVSSAVAVLFGDCEACGCCGHGLKLQ